MNKRIVISGWHKWLSLLVGLQCLIWTGTGIYFNQMDSEAASGNQYRTSVSHRGNTPSSTFTSLATLPIAEPILSAELIWISGTPLYQIKTELPLHDYVTQQHALYHAVTGLPWYIQPNDIQRIAVRSYTGPGEASAPELILPPFDFDGRQQNPLWKVSFSDEVHTNVYLNADTGRVIAHSNDHSRLKHLMLTLHFMDYTNSGGFNHPLIVAFAIATLMLAVSGLLLAYQRLPMRTARANTHIDVQVIQAGETTQLSLRANQPLLFALASAGIHVPTECGGGGTCGQCVVQTDTSVAINDVDRHHLSEDALASGERLSCQHLCSECKVVTLK
ncbi:2Fe-2S iron-sulfur cluster-binding protein [Alteromonas sp. AMM-1]|uniref:2Fe-2S iron-sulfur cluster-binding protein n=1 Tax=Alteromonas sp. AMM-1 TaxID=3394233 RepID=UPI0039A4F3D9